MAIRIITDTSSDFDLDAVHARGVGLVSMAINVGDASYADGIDLTHADFYDMLLSDGEPPKTSQPAPQEFLDHFERARAAGDDVIAILLSGELSGTVQSALNAKEMCGYDRVHIVDSRCATVGIQMMVRTRRCAWRGGRGRRGDPRAADLDEPAHAHLPRTGHAQVPLPRRTADAVEAGIGTLAGIHPLLGLKDGTLEVSAKCMGMKKTMRRLVELIQSIDADPDFRMRFIYSYDAAHCRELMRAFPGAVEAVLVELGPTLAAHAGPGVYGAVFIAAE